MSLSLFNLPVNTVVILVLWGLVTFVVWYFYRHAGRKNRVAFRLAFLLNSTLFFFILGINWFANRPPESPPRLAIFPFVNRTTPVGSISWESLALSEAPSRHLEQSDDWLISRLSWIMAGANRDSLSYRDYCLDFSRRIGLDYVVLGRVDKGKSGYEVAFSLFMPNQQTPVYDGRTAMGGIREIGEEVAAAIHAQIGGPQLARSKPLWNSERQIRWYFESKLSFFNNDLKTAYAHAQNAVKLDRSSEISLNYLAELELQSALQVKNEDQVPIAHFSKANSLLQSSTAIDGNNADTDLLFGELYLLNERWGLAEESLKRSFRANPWNSKLYNLLAQLHPDRYRNLGFRTERELLTRALFINPCDFHARVALANTYGIGPEAVRDVDILREGLRINPNQMSELMALANAYMAQNDLLNSLRLYKQILSIDPEHAEAYYNLGILRYHQKDYQGAAKFFQHAINLVDHPDSHLYLAYIYEKSGDIASAIAELERRVALSGGLKDRYARQAGLDLERLRSERREEKTPIIKKTSTQD